MKDLIEKIKPYDLLNNLFPGVVFVIVLGKITNFDLSQKDVVSSVFFYYFSGMVISRFGSIVVEPILKKFIKFAKYDDYITASNIDPKIDDLSTVNNIYRTVVSTFIMLLVAKICSTFIEKYKFDLSIFGYSFLVIILILFIFSYIKQTRYVVSRVEKCMQGKVSNEHN